MSRKHFVLIGLALIAYVITLRLLPHPPNFAPLTALAIFAGTKFPRQYAIGIVLAAAIVSDALVGFYNMPVMLTVWAAYVATALFSAQWFKKPTWLRGGFMVASSAMFFFAVTNFAVWAAGSYYPHTLAGLAECYTMALPFLRNSILGDMFYAASLFGLVELIKLATQFSKFQVKSNLSRRTS
jgi:hypothetical protein